MGGACSLKLAKEEEKLVARTSTVSPCLSGPHHLKHRAAVTMKSGSLLGKDVGNKIQESLSILLRVDSRDLCPCPMLDSFGCVSCFLLGIILCQDVNEAHEIYLLLRGPLSTPDGVDIDEGFKLSRADRKSVV